MQSKARLIHLEEINADQLKEAAEWLNNYRRFWEANLDSLDQYLHDVQSNNKE